VLLYGGRVVPFVIRRTELAQAPTVQDIRSAANTYGHRFLTTSGRAGRAVKVRSFEEYRDRLAEHFVVLDRQERHDRIARGLEAKARSLGGRVALHVALAHPERISRLVLVASTAGIEDPDLRAARRQADEELAADVEHATIAEFAERWTGQPLFAGTPPEAARFWRADLERNDPGALAAVLRGLGAGVMAPLWDRLGELSMPATVVAGERDERYTALGRRLAAGLSGARLVIVPGAGHGLPREAPQAVADAIATA